MDRDTVKRHPQSFYTLHITSLGFPAKPCAQMHSQHHLLPRELVCQALTVAFAKRVSIDRISHACEAMMKTSRTSPYSLKHSSSWALSRPAFGTQVLSRKPSAATFLDLLNVHLKFHLIDLLYLLLLHYVNDCI